MPGRCVAKHMEIEDLSDACQAEVRRFGSHGIPPALRQSSEGIERLRSAAE
jgi:hypothetical protein